MTDDIKRRIHDGIEAVASQVNPRPPRLYGFPGDEHLQNDPWTVIEQYCEEVDPDFRTDREIEEFDVQPTINLLPRVDFILEWIAEHVEEEAGFEHWHDQMSDAITDPVVIALADELRAAIARRITFMVADKLVATHPLTFVDGVPHYDGAPFEMITTNS